MNAAYNEILLLPSIGDKLVIKVFRYGVAVVQLHSIN